MGHTLLIWIKNSDWVSNLKQAIWDTTSYPSHVQSLIHCGRTLQDTSTIKDYGICPASTIYLNLRLHGSAARKNIAQGQKGLNINPTGPSYRNILKGNHSFVSPTTPIKNNPKPYIVEQLNQIPELCIEIPEIDDHRSIYESQALICRFNCF